MIWELAMKSMRYNLRINYLYSFFKDLNFTQGLWMIYLASKGMSLTQLGILEGIFHVTALVMEVPTGAIADMLGRKTSRLIGRVFTIAFVVLLLTGNSFAVYALSFILCAFSYNLESGAAEAFLYDTLAYYGEEKRYAKLYGRVEGLYQGAQIVTLSIAGFLAVSDYRLPFLTTIAATLIALVTGLFLIEPPCHTGPERKQAGIWASFKRQYIESFIALKASKKLIYIILFSSLLFAVNTLAFFYLQNYWKGQGYPESVIGLALASGAFCGVLGGLLAHRIRTGQRRFLMYFPFLISVPLLFLTVSKVGFVVFAFLGFLDSMLFVIVSDYINKLIESHVRATIISVQSAVFSLCMIALFPLFGALSDALGMTTAFYILAAVANIAVVLNLLLLAKKRRQQRNT